MHGLAHTHTRTVSHACTALGAFSPPSLHTQHTYKRTVSSMARCNRGPPKKWPSFIFFPQRVTSGGEQTWAKLLKIQFYRGVGATAEVKQSESCRQSFNLKRTRSPWGARGAGRIKKFNNSMFYGPRKWDPSTGAGWWRWGLALWSVHSCTKPPHTHTQKEVSHWVLSWAHDPFPRTYVQRAGSVGGRGDNKSSFAVLPALSLSPPLSISPLCHRHMFFIPALLLYCESNYISFKYKFRKLLIFVV